MKANEIKLDRFLSQNDTQFVIPVYQRNYDWKEVQCKQLFDDIFNVGQDENLSSHFIGSIVYVHDDVYSASGINELTIIDGQQRLTTITIIYLAIYKLAKELKESSLFNRINETYLINKFSSNEEGKLKLRPNENNDKAFQFLLRANDDEEFNEYSRLIENFDFFKTRINSENYEIILRGLSKLIFVEISLERSKDDAQRIFESLNSTGLDLSQADLIRNYILMGLKRKYQEIVYNKYWAVIESLAKDNKNNANLVSEFIRDYLTNINKNIPNKGKVYQEFKSTYPIVNFEDIEVILDEIKKYAKYYNKLINPENEKDNEISQQLRYINKLEINVSYPFLLQVYDDYNHNVIDKITFINVLEIIQSFAWRRFIIGLPTNALNKIFMRIYEDVEKNNYLNSLYLTLIKKNGSQRFPKTEEVINTLREKDIYNVQSKNRTYFLERLENYDNNEKVLVDDNPSITVEHIFPQNPDPKWKIELDEAEYKNFKDIYLNTVANLTLSGNNGKLGNKSFLEKRDLKIGDHELGYKYSRLWLNNYLSKISVWNKSNLDKRFELIANRFNKIWIYPEVNSDVDIEYSEINIFEADDPTSKKLEYAIFFNQKLFVTEASKLYQEVMKKLYELDSKLFFTTDLHSKLDIRKETENLRRFFPLGDSYFMEYNLSNIDKFNRLKYALEVFDCKDELIIKYHEE